MAVNFTMTPIPDVTLGAVTWPTVTYVSPAVPTFQEPPLGTVTTPTPPGYASPDIPQPVYGYPTTEAPPITQIEIPTPPVVVIDHFTMAVPDMDVTVPSSSVNWAYQAYLGVILDTLALQSATLDDATANIWGFHDQTNDTVWGEGFNLLTAMGCTDILAAFRAKERAYGKSLYVGARDALHEAFETRNARAYIGIILGVEKQKRSQYSQQKDLELAFAKDVVAKSIQNYNLMIEMYSEYVHQYQVLSERFQGEIAASEAELKALDVEIAVEKVKGEVSRSLLARYTAQLAANEELIRLYESQMQMAKKLAEAEALHIDAYRSSIQTFTLGVRNITEQAQQAVISSETAVMMAQTDEAQVYALELGTKAETLQIEVDGLRAKWGAELQAVASRNGLFDIYPAILDNEALVKGIQIDAQVLNINERERARLAEVQAELTIANARPAEAQADYAAHMTAASTMASEHSLRLLYETIKESDKFQFMEVPIDQAKAQMAEILHDAKITNIFNKHTS